MPRQFKKYVNDQNTLMAQGATNCIPVSSMMLTKNSYFNTPLSIIAESHREELEKKIIAAFKTFDHESNNSVDIREVGTIIRSLGCCPSEADLKVIIEEVEDEEPTSYIHLDKFLPIVTKIIEDNRHPSATYNQLLKSCLKLDNTNKGYLTWDELKHYLITAGEPFTEEEMDVLETTSLIGNSQHIEYREWITWLVLDEQSQT